MLKNSPVDIFCGAVFVLKGGWLGKFKIQGFKERAAGFWLLATGAIRGPAET